MGIEDVRVIRDSDMEGRGANRRVISRKGAGREKEGRRRNRGKGED